MTLNLEQRSKIKSVLRTHLLGDGGKDKRQQIINELGISESTIKSWTTENGSGIPVTEDLPTICNILGITLNQLFGIEDSKIIHALLLEDGYNKHPEVQDAVDKLLEIKKA